MKIHSSARTATAIAVFLFAGFAVWQPGQNQRNEAPTDELKSVIQGVEFEFVVIPPGVFTMGSDRGNADEKPPHQVTISRGFQMGKYEVTVRQFRVVGERTGYQTVAEKQGQGFTLTGEGWTETPGASW